MSDEYRLDIRDWDKLTLREQVNKMADFLAFHGFLIGCVDDDQKRQDSRREVLIRDLSIQLEQLNQRVTEVIAWVKKLHGYKTN